MKRPDVIFGCSGGSLWGKWTGYTCLNAPPKKCLRGDKKRLKYHKQAMGVPSLCGLMTRCFALGRRLWRIRCGTPCPHGYEFPLAIQRILSNWKSKMTEQGMTNILSKRASELRE